GRNVILLDVENASVGAALAHIGEGGAPTLFAEHRITLALPRTVDSRTIAEQIKNAADKALEKLGLVAARLRGNKATAERGELTHASIFLGAPWGVPNLAAGTSSFNFNLQKSIAGAVNALAPD